MPFFNCMALDVVLRPLFQTVHELQKAHQRVKKEKEDFSSWISLDLSISVSPVAHLCSFFFQRKQEDEEEHEERILSLFLSYIYLSLKDGNAEETAPCTETSLLNSLPIPEITVWRRSVLFLVARLSMDFWGWNLRTPKRHRFKKIEKLGYLNKRSVV